MLGIKNKTILVHIWTGLNVREDLQNNPVQVEMKTILFTDFAVFFLLTASARLRWSLRCYPQPCQLNPPLYSLFMFYFNYLMIILSELGCGAKLELYIQTIMQF